MISKIIFLWCTMCLSAFGQNAPSPDTLSVMNLASTVNFVNLLDGPSSVSHAVTTPTTNNQPTFETLQYYNNYAAAMYCQYKLKDLSCDPCQGFKNDVYDKTVIMNNKTDNTALVTISKTRREIVIAFRGTMNIWNVVLDLTTFAVDVPNVPGGIKLHAGFYSAAQSLYKDVVTNVGYLHKIYKDYKIVLTGQSLGAAIARVFLFILLAGDQFPDVNYECYTFGEPRSGNQAYVEFMNAQAITTARVVNNGDIVTHVPPVSLLGTTALGDYYLHCQPEFWYVNANNKRFCNTAVFEDPTCSDSLGPVYSLPDHATYLEVQYAQCVVGQPAPWLAIPGSILQPVGVIPPFPDVVENFLGGGASFVIVALDQVLGG